MFRPPLLLVLSGLPGVGKTTLARRVVPSLNCVYLRVDEVEAPLIRSNIDVGTVEQVLHRLDLRTLSLPRNRSRTHTREARSGTANLAQRRGRINPVENIAKRVNARRHRSAEMDD